MPTALAASIRSKILAGVLPMPEQAPGKVWLGPGTGKLCDACELPVPASEREYEIDLTDRTLRFHSQCMSVWQQQRAERMR